MDLTKSQQRGAVLTAFVAASSMFLALGTYEFMIIPAQWDLFVYVRKVGRRDGALQATSET